jgi:hypothetical protein
MALTSIPYFGVSNSNTSQAEIPAGSYLQVSVQTKLTDSSMVGHIYFDSQKIRAGVQANHAALDQVHRTEVARRQAEGLEIREIVPPQRSQASGFKSSYPMGGSLALMEAKESGQEIVTFRVLDKAGEPDVHAAHNLKAVANNLGITSPDALRRYYTDAVMQSVRANPELCHEGQINTRYLAANAEALNQLAGGQQIFAKPAAAAAGVQPYHSANASPIVSVFDRPPESLRDTNRLPGDRALHTPRPSTTVPAKGDGRGQNPDSQRLQ